VPKPTLDLRAVILPAPGSALMPVRGLGSALDPPLGKAVAAECRHVCAWEIEQLLVLVAKVTIHGDAVEVD
jgi:hypothetical protein